MPKEMTRVLFVLHTSEQTGAPMSAFYLLTALNREKFHPIVALPSPGIMEKKFLREGIEVRSFGVARFGKKEILRLAGFIRDQKISLVHANSLESYAGCVAARLTLRPVVWHIHEMLDVYISRVRLLLPFATKVVAVSRSCAQALSSFVNKEKVEVIYNGIPFPNVTCETKSFDKEAPRIVVNMGSIWPGKGYEYLISAARYVVDSFPQAKFLVVGELASPRFEPYLQELKGEIARNRLSDNLEFLGFVDDLARLLSSADVVSSSSMVESFGLGLLEAMCFCRPVVATNTGGIPEVVVDGETGILVHPGDAKALGNAIIKVLANPDLGCRLGLNGRKRAEELFRADGMALAFENLYAELLGKE